MICLEYFHSRLDIINDSVFLAPEFLKDFTYTTASDIYAFGILSFYLVTYQFPYISKQSVIELKKNFEQGPKTPKDIIPEISEKLNYFIMKAIQLDVIQRWTSFRVLIDILQGRDAMKFEKLSNQFQASESFATDIIRHKRHIFFRWSNRIFNIIAILALIYVGFVGYQNYFMKYKVVQIPYVESMSVDEALRTLGALNLDPKVVKHLPHPSIPENHVVRVEPPSGRSIKEGRQVQLFVSKGKREVQVPSFIGKSLSEIAFILDGSTLNIEQTPPVFSTTIDVGQVVTQHPLPNQYMYDNGTIQVTLSKGNAVQLKVVDDLEMLTLDVKIEIPKQLGEQSLQILERLSTDEEIVLYQDSHYSGDIINNKYSIQKTSRFIVLLNGDVIFEYPDAE
tara:strand:- start:8771 stop:9952 length:1182 start_codon:yes stop_codon:yes gene_type:complete